MPCDQRQAREAEHRASQTRPQPDVVVADMERRGQRYHGQDSKDRKSDGERHRADQHDPAGIDGEHLRRPELSSRG